MKKDTLIFGIRPTIEAIKAGKEIDKILIQKGLIGETFGELSQLMRESKIQFQYVPIDRLNRISPKNHQGIIAFLSLITYQEIENVLPMIYEQGKTPLILILDQITDVRNFGAIARTAECAGVHAIVIPEKGSAQVNADAIKTSAGALHNINVCRVKSLSQTLKFIKDSGLKIIACTEKADKIYTEADYSVPAAIVMGSEEFGISREVLNNSDEMVKIPIHGNIESLNVSVASGIIIYEALKQRSK